MKIEAKFEATAIEMRISIDGISYLVIYGEHINGYYCALPQDGIACELSDPYDFSYNVDKMMGAGIKKSVAEGIATAIKENC